jgi:hypothetical protein
MEVSCGLGTTTPPCRLAHRSDLLDEVEKVLAVLAHQRLTELVAETPDIGT